LVYGPRLASAVALVFDVLPGAFFLSSRFRHVAPLGIRLVLSTVSVVLPDTFELNGNLANVQWHLALLGLLLLVGRPPRTLFGHILDLLGLVLAGLTGPFGLLLSPLALLLWRFQERPRWLLTRLTVLAAATTVQGTAMLIYRNQRQPANSHASWDLLLWTLDRPLLAPLVGHQTFTAWSHEHWPSWVPAAVLALGLLVIAYALWRGPGPLRALWFLGAGILALTLANPTTSLPDLVIVGMRYFYLAALAWVSTLVWLALRAEWLWLRVLPILVLGNALLGAVPNDWRYADLVPTRFAVVAQQFDQAPRGTQAAIPEEPSPAWTLTLVKR
jgi:hypothetical protein